MKNGIEEVAVIVRAAIEQLNGTLPAKRAVDSAEDTVLLGDGGRLDSMGLVLLIAAIEEMVEQTWHARISLMDVVIDEARVPRTVGDLTRRTADLVSTTRAP